ncbi:MAG TPA: HDIG domain-containing protein, partial [candidate division Zixibacteria bacterium]|nr:HDIG domain-containing protein [candidate division Zixibacteria bacterium]
MDKTQSDSDENRSDIREQTSQDSPSRLLGLSGNRRSYFLLALTALFIVPFFIPFDGFESDVPAVGEINPREVIAPFKFDIIKPTEELARERQIARQNVPYTLDFIDGVASGAKAEFETTWSEAMKAIDADGVTGAGRIDLIRAKFPGISEESARTLAELRRPDDVRKSVLELLDEAFAGGVFSWNSLDARDTAHVFNIRRGTSEQLQPADRVPTVEALTRQMEERTGETFSSFPEKGKLVFELAKSYLRPNLLPDKELTERNRAKAIEGIQETRGIVLKDERIVDAHEIVTEEIHQKLLSLAQAKAERFTNQTVVYYALRVMARFLIALLVLGIFSKFMQIKFPKIWLSPRLLSLSLFALWMPILFAFIFRSVGWTEFLTPVAFSACLTAVILGLEPSLAVVFASSTIVALSSKNPHDLIITLLIHGAICTLFFVRVQVRKEVIKSIAYTSAAGVITIAVLELASPLKYVNILLRSISILPATVFGPLLAISLLPLFEKFAHVVTDFTLVDYTNTNAQILQQLAIEAPGTFHHSIVVGNMAETAAEAIGADPLLARAGALYHDIGKLAHPYYFSENLTDHNPHERLSPKMSFMVLSGHVSEGVRMAEKLGLPHSIVDIIRQHHGDGVMRFFYEKACEAGESVSEEEFRYSGPKPQSKEAAIVMMADTVEATVRSMGEIEKKSLNR